MFVVTALHDTGHGEEATTFCITENIVIAISAAINAEELGFEFYDETYVVVYNLAPNRYYQKRNFKDETTDPTIFYRQFNRRTKKWEERWLNEHCKQLFKSLTQK
jgi:hypothetical protein